MSRLESAILRLTAQRDCLARAAALVAELPGPVLEVGLGKGRTYDFLRSLLPEREIFAFDRSIGSYPDCTPDPDHVVLGDFRETLLAFPGRGLPAAALVHCDFGSERRDHDAALAAWLGPVIGRLVAPRGVIASDRALSVDGWERLELPEGVAPGRYFLYRA
jgi:hypothetical protein